MGLFVWPLLSFVALILLDGVANPTAAAPIFSPPPPPASVKELNDPLDPARFPPDALIPANVPLSSFQRRRLTEDLERLHQQGLALSQQGQWDEAFSVWYRELRGRQALGALAEIEALGRIGSIAWENNRQEDLGVISRRLETVKANEEKGGRLNPEILTALARAYQQMRNLDAAIAYYQTLRLEAQQAQDDQRETQILTILGELYLAKFDYLRAAEIYEPLLERARASQNRYLEGLYLQKLAEIYNKSAQLENAVRIKEDLAQSYIQSQKIERLPDLKIALGDDYRALKEAEKASKNYQEAYSLGWSLQQYGAASLALSKLADLYNAGGQGNYALQIYQRLLRVERQSYNYYGLMQTYEKIAQLYLQARQYDPALSAYQQSLSLARSLKYTEQETRLLNAIQQVQQERNPAPQ